MNRRPLGEVVSELATAVEPGADAIRVTTVAVDLPVEVVLRREAGELIFLADLPRWRWRSVFDTEPGRLAFELFRRPIDGSRRTADGSPPAVDGDPESAT